MVLNLSNENHKSQMQIQIQIQIIAIVLTLNIQAKSVEQFFESNNIINTIFYLHSRNKQQ